MGKKKDKSKDLDSTADTTQEDTTMGDDQNGVDSKMEYEQLCLSVNAIAQPMAGRKLAKKVYKLIKKSSKEKLFCRQGLSDVQRALRKGEKGVVILAGDVSPLEIYCHIPGVCELRDIPYVYTPSRSHLGLAAGHKRPTIMILVKRHDDYAELYDECSKAMEKLPIPTSV